MKIKTLCDKQKAKALKAMSEKNLERIKETDVERFSSLILVDYYNVIRDLMEALTALEGVKIVGEGAHRELINHTCEKQGLKESERVLIQELRSYRNRVNYDGFTVRTEYLKQNKQRIEALIKSLTKLVL